MKIPKHFGTPEREGWVVTLIDAPAQTVVVQPTSMPTKIPGLPFSGRNPSNRDKRLVISNADHWALMMALVEKYHGFFFQEELLIPAHVTPAGKVVPLEQGPGGWSDKTTAEKQQLLERLCVEALESAKTPESKGQWQTMVTEARAIRSQGGAVMFHSMLEHVCKREGLPVIDLEGLAPPQS